VYSPPKQLDFGILKEKKLKPKQKVLANGIIGKRTLVCSRTAHSQTVMHNTDRLQ